MYPSRLQEASRSGHYSSFGCEENTPSFSAEYATSHFVVRKGNLSFSVEERSVNIFARIKLADGMDVEDQCYPSRLLRLIRDV